MIVVVSCLVGFERAFLLDLHFQAFMKMWIDTTDYNITFVQHHSFIISTNTNIIIYTLYTFVLYIVTLI